MLSSGQSVTVRLVVALVLFVVEAGGFSPRTAAQTPEAVGTPEAVAFRLVALIPAEDWAVMLTAPATPIAGEELAGPSLLAALREGGFVIYFRHAKTDDSPQDSDLSTPTNCATQRNLSEEGRAQARLIGDSISDLDIPIGEVLAGELCRTTETAEIAFGRVTPTEDLTTFDTAASESEQSARVEALRRLLATPPAPGTNTVLVSHQVNLQVAANVALAEGEAAIFLPLGTAQVPATPPAGS